jgi:hypothetical protein
MNNEIEEMLRQSFIDETKNKLWSENGDNDCGFAEEYVFWLEQKLLKRTAVLEELMKVYKDKGQLLSFNVNLVREVLEND